MLYFTGFVITKSDAYGVALCVLFQYLNKEEIALDARHERFLRPRCTSSTLRERKSFVTKQMK